MQRYVFMHKIIFITSVKACSIIHAHDNNDKSMRHRRRYLNTYDIGVSRDGMQYYNIIIRVLHFILWYIFDSMSFCVFKRFLKPVYSLKN